MALKQLDDILGEYSETGKTGTLMLVLDDKSLGRFYIAGGALATARYKNRQGQEAYQSALGSEVQSYTFHENADLVRSSELIDGLVGPAATNRASSGVSPVGASGGLKLSHVMRSALEDLLADYIGPVAPIIIADIPPSLGIDSAIDLLSREIGDTAAAAEFVQAARRIVEA